MATNMIGSGGGKARTLTLPWTISQEFKMQTTGYLTTSAQQAAIVLSFKPIYRRLNIHIELDEGFDWFEVFEKKTNKFVCWFNLHKFSDGDVASYDILGLEPEDVRIQKRNHEQTLVLNLLTGNWSPHEIGWWVDGTDPEVEHAG